MNKNIPDSGKARIRVRARAVDMLGRQQITGIPTAIHELFKNAHDAYADRVEVDYYREDDLFILRDDGIGMTRKDFENKWLTLGTESKVDANQVTGFVPKGKAKRTITGEKGIGRLAIATIGRQVLVVTRALREDGLHDVVFALIHWGLFEIPGIDLDEIIIPISEVSGGTLPDNARVAALAQIVHQNVEALSERIPNENKKRILDDLSLFSFGPAEIAELLQRPSLLDDGCGTHFYILPTDSIIQNDIDNGSDDEASNMEKMLLGFSNTMYADQPPLMRTAFRDHHGGDDYAEIIGGEAFFTPAEFALADQHIEGTFDEYGQFRGFVSIYHRPAKEHIVRWSGGNGSATECGPFRIKFAYLQGETKDSSVPMDQYPILYRKTNKIGGLYIYRDGIRILPYGRSDYDFLDIERRRTKSASDWFFSYRRIYGAVEVSHDRNVNLIEKAGREGFRENRAYRQLRDILINFFIQLAFDFFRDTANDTLFTEVKTELQRQAKLIKQREKQVAARKKQFSNALDAFFRQLEKGYFTEEAEDIRQDTKKRIESVRSISDPDRAAHQLLNLETESKGRVMALRQQMTLTRPRSIGFSKTVMADWDAYQKNRGKLEAELIAPLESDLDQMITQLNENHIGVNRRRRIAHQLEGEKRTVQRRSNVLKREVGEQIQLFQSELQGTLQQKLGILNKTVEQVLIDFERTDAARLAEDELADRQQQWESNIESALSNTEEYLSALRDRLRELTETIRQGDLLDADTMGAVETQSQAYKEQLDTYFEFAQVGMAIGIVQHEFSSTVLRIRKCIKELKPWADGTPQLQPIYRDIRHNFEHLDGYLNLFTPLNRRLYRKEQSLSGYEIFRYLQDIFGDRVDRHEIKLEHTPAFDANTVMAFPSTLLPVFVNLMDNAIYWITSDKDSDRYIRLDADERGYAVSNGGPGIAHRDADRIFEFGVSHKPGGRGMGLYISRESLKRDGFDLELVNAGETSRPMFLIRTGKSVTEGEILDNGESS